MDENNKARRSLPITTNVNFFDKEGHYFGQISVYADGLIWIDTVDEEFRFENPDEFFQALHEIRVKQNDI